MPQPVFRFAPSPNGYLHLGHAYSALLNYDMACAANGRLLLRIEDIDQTRCRPEFEAAIYEDLGWLGIRWEAPVMRQSEGMERYRAALNVLEHAGLVYPGFESRADIACLVAERERRGEHWPSDPDGSPLYPGNARDLSPTERAKRIAAGMPYALRLDMTAAIARTGALFFEECDPGDARRRVAAAPSLWGDVVVARKETPTSYHLSVVVDDAWQGITHVVRGQDLAAATGVHRVLQALLGLSPPTYHHHRLILDGQGNKLAKSTGATALRALRERGLTPHDVRRLVGLA